MAKRTKQINFRVQEGDSVFDWINAQENIGVSLKLLIRHTLRHGGPIDFPEALADGVFEQERELEPIVTAQPKRRTRPRKEVKEVIDATPVEMIDVITKPTKVVTPTKPEKPTVPEKPVVVEPVVVPSVEKPSDVAPKFEQPSNMVTSFALQGSTDGALAAMFDGLIQQQQNDN